MNKKIVILCFFMLFVFNNSYSQNFDIDLLRTINIERNRDFDGSLKLITNTSTPLSIAYPIVAYGIGYFSNDTTLKYNSAYIGATIICSGVITELLKLGIGRERPFETYPFIDKQASSLGSSFPSGHTAIAFAFATSLSVKYPEWYVIIPSYLWASAVAYSRMHLGMHYPSDVLAGAIIGAGSAYLCYEIENFIKKLADVP